MRAFEINQAHAAPCPEEVLVRTVTLFLHYIEFVKSVKGFEELRGMLAGFGIAHVTNPPASYPGHHQQASRTEERPWRHVQVPDGPERAVFLARISRHALPEPLESQRTDEQNTGMLASYYHNQLLFEGIKNRVTGIVDLPLHPGKAPRWLFGRMTRLAKAVGDVIAEEFGTRELVTRMADPLWFQALGCALGFDWHSSGVTTVTVGAIKGAGIEGLGVAGGKGYFRRIPGEIEEQGDLLGLSEKNVDALKTNSKLSAKADTVGLLDGFQLYHHAVVFDGRGNWTVVQQGMNDRWARRYHVSMPRRFDEEPNAGVACDFIGEPLNLVDTESHETRNMMVELLEELPRYRHAFTGQATLSGYYVRFPESHWFDLRSYNNLLKAREADPADFEELMVSGVNTGGMRALALLAELIYDSRASRRDPVKYSFAHGGKDGVPYPVNRVRYDKSIEVLRNALEGSNVQKNEKLGALRRLSAFACVKLNYEL